ncbi:hypothetical protein GCG54_00006937 [Colletotrichum gloeosporioides]|uniref:CHAT domain-containing protein n=1 Tax=Colletotrichum gloeosporioides TaxID=474922 RepID=A0A8H4CQK9_COLGL|nr:uncharacterized protein GCG54_00006937 [Colletotrichum gloeosporioides]KAF3808316.1 hypothetical protein GCG54_00006937 [Colletotrichum gloeosporioides]
MPDIEPNRGVWLHNLAVSFWKLFERTQELDNLEMAIKRGEDALVAMPSNCPEKATILANLTVSLRTMHGSTSDITYLRRAAICAEEALAAVPQDDPTGPVIMDTVAMTHLAIFDQTGNKKNLRFALQLGQRAATEFSDDDAGKWSILNNLALLFRVSFERTGDPGNLQTAITLGEKALQKASDQQPATATILHTLSDAHQARFDRVGDLRDLDMAIKRGEEALQMTSPDRPERASRLKSRAHARQMRFLRTGNLNDLRVAIARGEEAVAMTPDGHQELGNRLNSLAISFELKFKTTNNPEDLQSAISNMEAAIELLDKSHAKRGLLLANLASLLRVKFETTGQLEGLEMAIELGQEALRTIPDDHAKRESALVAVAGLLFLKSESNGEWAAFDQSINLCIEAANLSHSPPLLRIRSAVLAGSMLPARGKWEEASRITELAVSLLPRVASRQLSQHDQQHLLSEFSGVVTMAASLALEAGRPPLDAVKLLELGRGIIIGLRSGLRSDVSELREHHPRLAKRFEELRVMLDSPYKDMSDIEAGGDSLSAMRRRNDRHQASIDLDEIISQIRLLPDFGHFLLPPSVEELNAAASDGPIVLINSSGFRCDAFLIETDTIRSIRLPKLHHPDVKRKVDSLTSIRSHYPSHQKTRDEMFSILEWLWDVAVCPILDTLGFRKFPMNNNWPRIWWIPTGELSSLPLHAAGRHASFSTDTALDRVVSSYSPSVRALLHARRQIRTARNLMIDHALLVSMTTTPECSNLRFAKNEVEKLESLLPTTMKRTRLEQPCSKDVLRGLEECSIFHFAGHGKSHLSNPSKSSLLTRDWQEHMLTVEDLMNLNLNKGDVPAIKQYYHHHHLSACSTNKSHSADLQDEAIYLVTACQLAGFKHVIGSLWETSDRYSVEVAEEVYRTIYTLDKAGDDTSISLGVHKAARRLRDITSLEHERKCTNPSDSTEHENEELESRNGRVLKSKGKSKGSNPLIWAAYIHVGP